MRAAARLMLAERAAAGRAVVEWALAAAAVLAVVGGVAVWQLGPLAVRRRPSPPPNILLITLDTTRADHLGAYGHARAETPNLDRLAAGGVLFERVVSPAPLTLPAHVSLFTGQYPFVHGVRNNGNFRLGDRVATLATALHDRGYRTAAFVSAFVLDRRSGLSRGFDVYDDHLDATDTAGERTSDVEVERRGDRTGFAARQWLANHLRAPEPRAPFFVWVHLYDPHDPYSPPPPFADRFRDDPYDGEIAFDDSVVGALAGQLTEAKAASSTILAVAGDHGESLGEHGEMTHAIFVYESALRVPMIIDWPGHLAPARVRALVREIDLAPSLLDLAGQPALPAAQGRSVLELARGRHRGRADGQEVGLAGTTPFASASASAYAETYFPLFFMGWAPLRSIQDDRWKFIDAPTPELYDLVSDPNERSNIAAREPARTAALRRALDALTGAHAGAMTPVTPEQEAIEKLAALGYVGSAGDPRALTGGGNPMGVSRRPDPKAMIGVFNRLRVANSAISRRPADAEAVASEVLERDRQNAFATLILARAQMQQNRCREATISFQRYAALVPTSADAHHWMAVCAVRLGEPNRALDEASAALAIDPLYVSARLLRAGLSTERGRLDQAAADYRQAIELQPSNADAHSGYGVLLAARREPERAIAEFQRALGLRSELPDVRLALGRLLEEAGRLQEARTEFERVALSPTASAGARSRARARLARMTTEMSR